MYKTHEYFKYQKLEFMAPAETKERHPHLTSFAQETEWGKCQVDTTSGSQDI